MVNFALLITIGNLSILYFHVRNDKNEYVWLIVLYNSWCYGDHNTGEQNVKQYRRQYGQDEVCSLLSFRHHLLSSLYFPHSLEESHGRKTNTMTESGDWGVRGQRGGEKVNGVLPAQKLHIIRSTGWAANKTTTEVRPRWLVAQISSLTFLT